MKICLNVRVAGLIISAIMLLVSPQTSFGVWECELGDPLTTISIPHEDDDGWIEEWFIDDYNEAFPVSIKLHVNWNWQAPSGDQWAWEVDGGPGPLVEFVNHVESVI